MITWQATCTFRCSRARVFCILRYRQDGVMELAGLALAHEERGALDCKDEGAACRGFPPCCNNNVCYWESGFSPTRVRPVLLS